MTQPKFAPILPEDEVRDLHKLPPPAAWYAKRPADFRPAPAGRQPGRGVAGPDQGYGLLLAERFAGRLVLAKGEHKEDALKGASVLAMKRAALFGRAPVVDDLELALELFGYLGEASPLQVEVRRAAFGGVAHDYWRCRELADRVPEETLRMTLAAVRERLGASPESFKELTGIDH